MSKEDLPSVESLWAGCLDVTPVDRDWEGWPETFEFYDAPTCRECDSYAEWQHREWVCPNEDCEEEEVEIDFDYVSGPMMNYSYEVFSRGQGWNDAYQAASLIAHLPLCVVSFPDDDDLHLALTGGGMDLSWEICEAYMRLGFLPPTHFADLPRMAGYPRGATQRWVVEGCIEALRVSANRQLASLPKLQEMLTRGEEVATD